ncbi:Metallo-peptidase family M12-domain-containing protein [Balamuthia mandrillaris]
MLYTMVQQHKSLLALACFLCFLGLSLSLDYADIYARSNELPEQREFLSSISFQLHRNKERGITTRTANNATFASEHSMSLSFKALSREFAAVLHQNAELFAPDAEVSIYEEDDLVERYTPESTAYLGEATIDGVEKAGVSAVVVDYSKGIFHMTIWNEESGESYVVEPTYLHPTLSKRASEEDVHDMLGNNMVVFKESTEELANIINQAAPNLDDLDAAEREDTRCGTPDDDERHAGGEEDVSATSFADVMDPTSSCPPRRNSYLQMGIATDNQYVRKAGGTNGARNTISFIFNTMQSHYYRAVRTKPVLKSLRINSRASSLGFNTASCPSSVQSRLSPFCSWRTRQSDRSIGLWHLLSGCLPDRSGVAGRAYYGAICLYSTRGCGIGGYLGGNARWVIPAHEIGHNFGARHSSNIMAASVNSRATGFPSTAISQMCRYTFRNRQRSACLLSSLSRSRLEEENQPLNEAATSMGEDSSAIRSAPLFF